MPDAIETAAMQTFEDRLCVALERDEHAILAAVLTFDGARQWMIYTPDVGECGYRLEAMPQENDPYPVEIDAFDDPKWDYVTKKIIKVATHDA